MTEVFLQYVWSQRLYDSAFQTTTGGISIEVLNPGRWNIDSGPDFFNAQIRVGNVTWSGNVEIHLTSDDWYRHAHHTDPAYDNVILHIVGKSTGRVVKNSRGEEIPEVVISYPQSLIDNYGALRASQKTTPVRCAPYLLDIPSVLRSSWLDALLVERMELKCRRLEILTEEFNGDLDQAFFCVLARAVGGKINSEPMELMARHTPVRVLLQHRNTMQMEALLLGQSGLLQAVSADAYLQRLRNEYELLRAKFGLTPLDAGIWKYARMRPQNFPDIRLVQLAAIVAAIPGNYESTLLQPLDKMLSVLPSDYWTDHYRLAVVSEVKVAKRVGKQMRHSIVINAVIPFLMFCARRKGDIDMQAAAVAMLRELKVEENAQLRIWSDRLFGPADEGEAQALIHLMNEYCLRDRCLFCRFGHHLLKNGVKPRPRHWLEEHR